MSVLDWLISGFSDHRKALSLYRRGMSKANKRNHQGALNDYTASLELRDIPADVKAVVLFNRALVFIAAGENQNGISDLDAVLAMDDLLPNIRTMARLKLEKMKTRDARRGG